MPQAHVNGQTIEYEVRGEGEPMLLIMGLGAQLIVWPEELIEKLIAKGFCVVVFDNRDAGLSSKFWAQPVKVSKIIRSFFMPSKARPDYQLSDMADDAVCLLDHLGLDRVHVVGASMGGMIAQCVAIQYPKRVMSLTSVMSHTGDRKNGRPKASLLAKMGRAMARGEDSSPEGMLKTERLISGPTFDEALTLSLIKESLARDPHPELGLARQLMAIIAAPDRTAALQKLRVPTLVVHGILDPLVRPSGGTATAAAIAGSRLIMYPDMAHDMPPSRLGEIVDEITTNTCRPRPEKAVA